MTGHSPPATVAAVQDRVARGITAMLPTEDAALRRRGDEAPLRDVELAVQPLRNRREPLRRPHLPARSPAGPKILVQNHCYHGSVDETITTLVDGEVRLREGNVGAPVDPAETTRIVEINDLEALERELAHGDVACVLVEPALTNIGIVLAEDGYHERLRELTRETGTLLVIDETHTLCCGPGGYTGVAGLEPDFLTMGKAIGGGVPIGAYGFTDEVAARVTDSTVPVAADVGGVGGTLAGNALSLAAARATLTDVLTDEAFERMIALGERFESAVSATIAEHSLPWSVTRLGCRAEYMFSPTPPRTGGEAAAALWTRSSTRCSTSTC